MKVITFNAAGEMCENTVPEWTRAGEIGYTPLTTLWQDLSIHELNGDPEAIAYTAQAVIAGRDVKQITELALVLNHKGFQWYAIAAKQSDESGRMIAGAYSDLYFRLWEQVHEYARQTLTGKDAEYYFKITD